MSPTGLRPPPDFPLGELDRKTFLREYWQKKPCLLRAVWSDIEQQLPIDGDELAGLAAMEGVDARLVSGTFEAADWRVDYGPFEAEDYARLGPRDWTLLVQDVEKHYPPLQNWLTRFEFLPSWRLDDIMISFAAPGGSVGPHTDQYDVFLFQASGRRRWQLSENYSAKILDHEEIRVLESFEPDSDWLLEPGDLLYLPPGVAHYGVAEESCLTYSIGLRAPSKAELLASLAEYHAALERQGGRYCDPDLELYEAENNGEMAAAGLRRLATLIQTHMPTTELAHWFCQFIAGYRLSGSPAPPEKPLTGEELREAIKNGEFLVKNPWSRFCWRPEKGHARFYATGMDLCCRPALARHLCTAAMTVSLDDIGAAHHDTDIVVLRQLYNHGHLMLDIRESLSCPK